MYIMILNVAGVTFEGRQKILRRLCKEVEEGEEEVEIRLKHEPENPYDSNAIGVMIRREGGEWERIGYIPRTNNKEVLELIEDDLIKSVSLARIGICDGIYFAKVRIAVKENEDHDERD